MSENEVKKLLTLYSGVQLTDGSTSNADRRICDFYDSAGAHRLASEFASLTEYELQAIAFNFQAFNNYLFSQTEFRLLTASKEGKNSTISTGALESLYNLSNDGLGDITVIEQMNVINYLTILRKKIIETVRSMSSMKMEKVDIEEETGLPIHIINQIL